MTSNHNSIAQPPHEDHIPLPVQLDQLIQVPFEQPPLDTQERILQALDLIARKTIGNQTVQPIHQMTSPTILVQLPTLAPTSTSTLAFVPLQLLCPVMSSHSMLVTTPPVVQVQPVMTTGETYILEHQMLVANHGIKVIIRGRYPDHMFSRVLLMPIRHSKLKGVPDDILHIHLVIAMDANIQALQDLPKVHQVWSQTLKGMPSIYR